MQPSIARDSGQVDPRRSTTDIPPPQSATLGLHPVVRRLLLINRPRRDGTLSRCWWYTAATGGSRTRDLAIAKSSLVPLGHRVIGAHLRYNQHDRSCNWPDRHSHTDWPTSLLHRPYYSSAVQSSCPGRSLDGTSASPCCQTASSSAWRPTNASVLVTSSRNISYETQNWLSPMKKFQINI